MKLRFGTAVSAMAGALSLLIACLGGTAFAQSNDTFPLETPVTGPIIKIPGSPAPGWSYTSIGTAAESYKDVTLGPPSWTKIVSTVPGSTSLQITYQWGEPELEQAIFLGYFTGYRDGTFRPKNPISREEFVTVLDRAFNVPSATATVPSGWKVDAWAKPYVEDALAAGLLKPSDYPSGVDMTQPITRQEIAELVVRADQGQGVSFSLPSTQAFSDVPPSSPYYTAIQEAASAGIVKGEGNGVFDPTGDATREQAAAMLLRAVKEVPPTGSGQLPYANPPTSPTSPIIGATPANIEAAATYPQVLSSLDEDAALKTGAPTVDLSNIAPYVTPEILAGLHEQANIRVSELPKGSHWNGDGAPYLTSFVWYSGLAAVVLPSTQQCIIPPGANPNDIFSMYCAGYKFGAKKPYWPYGPPAPPGGDETFFLRNFGGDIGWRVVGIQYAIMAETWGPFSMPPLPSESQVLKEENQK